MALSIFMVQYNVDDLCVICICDWCICMAGVFMDTKSGYAEYKVDTKQYPVICMELLEGGDMFDRIQMRKTVSEQYIARIFRDVVLALDGVHKKGFLHRYRLSFLPHLSLHCPGL